MRRRKTFGRALRSPRVSLLVLAVAVSLAALAGPASAAPRAAAGRTQAVKKTVAKKAKNATLGETVLTSLKNRTLYTLSAEVHGRFICVGACLSTWHPLVVPANVKPLGPTQLGKVKRPDGRFQVTFKGRPLYAFAGDTKAGDANGQGFKDVGTWHAASLGKISSQPEPQPQPENPNYPY